MHKITMAGYHCHANCKKVNKKSVKIHMLLVTYSNISKPQKYEFFMRNKTVINNFDSKKASLFRLHEMPTLRSKTYHHGLSVMPRTPDNVFITRSSKQTNTKNTDSSLNTHLLTPAQPLTEQKLHYGVSHRK